LDNALTIESPVTTVYRMAPNAAAAMVPIAYSTVLMPASSVAATIRRACNARIVLCSFTFISTTGLLHHRPDHIRSPASPATTGTIPRHMKAGR
jgi:hypothetical protein